MQLGQHFDKHRQILQTQIIAHPVGRVHCHKKAQVEKQFASKVEKRFASEHRDFPKTRIWDFLEPVFGKNLGKIRLFSPVLTLVTGELARSFPKNVPKNDGFGNQFRFWECFWEIFGRIFGANFGTPLRN